jgi:hypothetical protein
MPEFTADDYKLIVRSLDAVIEHMKTKFGKTEQEAQDWLASFMSLHYFKVWREMNQ